MPSPFSSPQQPENAIVLAGVLAGAPAALIAAWSMVSMCFSSQLSSAVQRDLLDGPEDVEFTTSDTPLPETLVTATKPQEFSSEAPLSLPIDDNLNYSTDDGSVCLIVENPLNSASLLKRSTALLAMATLVGAGSLVLCLLRQKTIAHAPSAPKDILSIHVQNGSHEASGDSSQESASSPVSVDEVDILELPASGEQAGSVSSTDDESAPLSGESNQHAAEEATDDLTAHSNVRECAEAQHIEVTQEVLSSNRADSAPAGEPSPMMDRASIDDSPHCSSGNDESSSNSSEEGGVVGGSLFSKKMNAEPCSPGGAPFPAVNNDASSACSLGQCIMS